MSSYSFSHQFYQHWTCAPEPIRAAIIQELTDITTLLHTETPFENFVFSVPNLDAHLDELYKIHDTEQAAAKEIADKQAQYRAAAEQQRLKEDEQKNKAQEDKITAEAKQKQQDQDARLKADNNTVANNVNTDNKSTDDSQNSHDKANDMINKEDNKLINDRINGANDNPIKAVTNKFSQTTMIDLSLKKAKLSAANETLIRELERHVDDYLSEQMAQMSENLKSWLRAEVTQQLAEPLTEQGQAVENSATKK